MCIVCTGSRGRIAKAMGNQRRKQNPALRAQTQALPGVGRPRGKMGSGWLPTGVGRRVELPCPAAVGLRLGVVGLWELAGCPLNLTYDRWRAPGFVYFNGICAEDDKCSLHLTTPRFAFFFL